MKKWILVFILLFGVGLGIGGVIGPHFTRQEQVVRVKEEVMGIRQQLPTPTPEPKVITMAAVGDVMLGRTVREQMMKKGDWSWPFREVGTRLVRADVTVGNLEAPIVDKCTQHENRMVFCMNPEAIEGLTGSGFDVVTLANNHMLNYGTSGLESTKKYLEGAGILGTYSGELVIKEVGGLKIGFLGYDDVSKPLNLNEVTREIASAAAQTDMTVAMVHWGNEYMASPSARQREVAQAMTNGGVDLILGSHPHWVQNVEKLGETLVFWSLGNFVFDQMWSEETRLGEIAEIRFKMQDARIAQMEYELVPVKIFEYGQPRF